MMDDPKESMMSNGTTISPQMQTLMALDSKSRELNELASALSHKMNGGPGDTTIQLRLRDIFAETTDISARRALVKAFSCDCALGRERLCTPFYGLPIRQHLGEGRG
jgi:hypothetical protein